VLQALFDFVGHLLSLLNAHWVSVGN